MSIDHVLAVVPVADFEAAHAWYERLFGRPADNLPMGVGKGAGPRSYRDGEQGRAAIRDPRSRRQHDHLHRALPRPVLKARAAENPPGSERHARPDRDREHDGVIDATEGWFDPAGGKDDISGVETALRKQREAADALLLRRGRSTRCAATGRCRPTTRPA